LERLRIDFSRLPVVYPSTVAMLCAWFESHRSHLKGKTVEIVEPSTDAACQWLDKVNFLNFLRQAAPQASSDAITVALHSIEPGDPKAPDVVVDKVSGLLRRHAASLAGDVLHSTQTALAEVVENVTRHADLVTPAFACGQVHPATHRFSFCVADSGIGLRESFRRAPYQPARERLESGEDPLDLAIEPLMSSKYGMGHSGYGLFYASELCSQTDGAFIISSENASLLLSGSGIRESSTHRRWPGTVVNLMISTTVPIEGGMIWSKLPSEDEDDWITTYLEDIRPPFIAMHSHGVRLYTRESARDLREQMRDAISNGTAISFEHVTTVTPSFADEFFRVLFEDLGEDVYRAKVRVVKASAYIKNLIELVLMNRPSRRRGIG
jgi:anti-sigma regulatory factor (Ser/Thr protein kinase)